MKGPTMKIFQLLALFALLLLPLACAQDKSANHKSDTQTMSTAKDDCPMCPGVQKADANGYCPKCGMKVRG